MSNDPILDLAEQGAEHGRELARLSGRVDAHADRLRPNQADAIREAGLPADLVAVETNVWRRVSPARNRWPDIAEFDQRVAELQQRQAAKADELRDREMAAPAKDNDRLAAWQLDGEQGPRPEPQLPAIQEAIRERQQEWEALTRATEIVLADKVAFVQKYRPGLIKDADRHADEARRHYLELIDQVANARAELYASRRGHSLGSALPRRTSRPRTARPACRRQTQAARGDGLNRIGSPGAGPRRP